MNGCPRNQWYVAGFDDELAPGALLALKPVLLSPDAGAVRARRKLAALVAAEQAASPQAASA